MQPNYLQIQRSGTQLKTQPKPSNESSCFTCWCWFIQIVLWISLLLTPFLIDPTLYIIISIIYLIYIITEFCSPSFSYIIHLNKNDTMYEKMGKLFQTPPTITFTAECYHYETQHYTEKDSNGRVTHKTRRRKIITFFDTMNLPYYSTKDVSGLFLLDVNQTVNKNKMFIKLHLQKEINFADEISYFDYLMHKDSFWRRNRFRDVHMDFHEKRNINGFNENNLVQICDTKPKCFHCGYYVLWTIIPFVQFYKRYIDSFCIYQSFKIRKLISTRYNLMNEQYVNQYSHMSPAININNQLHTYNSLHTGYCNQNIEVNLPTLEEINQAQQYKDKIPNYTYQNVGDSEIGVVQDIPTFEEVNYDLPPPAFSESVMNVMSENDKIIHDNNYSYQGVNNYIPAVSNNNNMFYKPS